MAPRITRPSLGSDFYRNSLDEPSKNPLKSSVRLWERLNPSIESPRIVGNVKIAAPAPVLPTELPMMAFGKTLECPPAPMIDNAPIMWRGKRQVSGTFVFFGIGNGKPATLVAAPMQCSAKVECSRAFTGRVEFLIDV